MNELERLTTDSYDRMNQMASIAEDLTSVQTSGIPNEKLVAHALASKNGSIYTLRMWEETRSGLSNSPMVLGIKNGHAEIFTDRGIKRFDLPLPEDLPDFDQLILSYLLPAAGHPQEIVGLAIGGENPQQVLFDLERAVASTSAITAPEPVEPIQSPIEQYRIGDTDQYLNNAEQILSTKDVQEILGVSQPQFFKYKKNSGIAINTLKGIVEFAYWQVENMRSRGSTRTERRDRIIERVIAYDNSFDGNLGTSADLGQKNVASNSPTPPTPSTLPSEGYQIGDTDQYLMSPYHTPNKKALARIFDRTDAQVNLYRRKTNNPILSLQDVVEFALWQYENMQGRGITKEARRDEILARTIAYDKIINGITSIKFDTGEDSGGEDKPFPIPAADGASSPTPAATSDLITRPKLTIPVRDISETTEVHRDAGSSEYDASANPATYTLPAVNSPAPYVDGIIPPINTWTKPAVDIRSDSGPAIDPASIATTPLPEPLDPPIQYFEPTPYSLFMVATNMYVNQRGIFGTSEKDSVLIFNPDYEDFRKKVDSDAETNLVGQLLFNPLTLESRTISSLTHNSGNFEMNRFVLEGRTGFLPCKINSSNSEVWRVPERDEVYLEAMMLPLEPETVTILQNQAGQDPKLFETLETIYRGTLGSQDTVETYCELLRTNTLTFPKVKDYQYDKKIAADALVIVGVALRDEAGSSYAYSLNRDYPGDSTPIQLDSAAVDDTLHPYANGASTDDDPDALSLALSSSALDPNMARSLVEYISQFPDGVDGHQLEAFAGTNYHIPEVVDTAELLAAYEVLDTDDPGMGVTYTTKENSLQLLEDISL